MQVPPGSDDPDIVGTNAWAANGGAPLTRTQKLKQLLAANLAYLQELPGETRWMLGSRGLVALKHVPRVGIDELREYAVPGARAAGEHLSVGPAALGVDRLIE